MSEPKRDRAEYMRDYRAKKAKEQAGNLEGLKDCIKCSQMLHGHMTRDSIWMESHLQTCRSCQRRYHQLKKEQEDPIPVIGAKLWDSEEPESKKRAYQPDPTLPKSDQLLDEMMHEDPNQETEYVKGEPRGTRIGQKRKVPRIFEDSDHREES